MRTSPRARLELRRAPGRLAGLALLVLLTPRAFAQSSDAAPRTEPSWSFTLAPYYWATGFDGDLTLDGQQIEGDGDSNGFPGELSLSGFLGHFEARKGPWAFALSPVFLKVTIDGDDTPPVDTDITLSGAIVEGFTTYEFATGWDALAGLRYYGLDTEVEVTSSGVPQPELDSGRDWLDPIVGLRWRGSPAARWWLQARADVGGFGIGSDFAWNAAALVGYELSGYARLFLGYRALDFDFADGSGQDRVEYDVRFWGPLVGVSFDL